MLTSAAILISPSVHETELAQRKLRLVPLILGIESVLSAGAMLYSAVFLSTHSHLQFYRIRWSLFASFLKRCRCRIVRPCTSQLRKAGNHVAVDVAYAGVFICVKTTVGIEHDACFNGAYVKWCLVDRGKGNGGPCRTRPCQNCNPSL